MINHRTQNHGMRFTRSDLAILKKIAKQRGISVSTLVNQEMGRIAQAHGYIWEGLLKRGDNQFKQRDSEGFQE